MLALLYLVLAIYLGDQLCRRFFRFVSLAHRYSSAVIVGILLSSWFTYLAAWVFRATAQPLLCGDLCFLTLAIGAIWAIRRLPSRTARFVTPRVPGSAFWDWAVLLAFMLLVSWLMFATLSYKNGTLLIGEHEWSDFGPNTAIIQNFAVGHNFPTRYPHFSGETIRYHFLFYFQAGNLTFLGLNLARSLNLLSIITLVSLLALLMTMGQLLFRSRTVGRIGAALFFFHGTLSFISFFKSQPSLPAAFDSILGLQDFLFSGYPYRGESWGIWTQVVYLNQRHFASAVALLVIVLLFLIDRYQQHAKAKVASTASEEPNSSHETYEAPLPLPRKPPASARFRALVDKVITFDKSFFFAGFLLGLLPFWNALVFTAAFAILFALFIAFPCRRQMVGLGLMAGLVALPQLVLLKAGGVQTPTHSLLHWGYIIEPPTLDNVVSYLGFSFGLKWGLILIALAFATWFQRKVFLALCTMYVLTFCLELSLETLANHKYLNIWLVLGNLFVASAVWRLWLIRPAWLTIITRPVSLLALATIMVSGAIDLVPIHNSSWVPLKYEGDPLVKWVRENTRPHDIFLSDRFVNHQILLAGRRIFYGWPSFSWGAGYDTTQRDSDFRELFESSDPYAVFRLLRKHRIAYVAIDEGVRHGEFLQRCNEELYELNCPTVWKDAANEYAGLTIYKVPNPPPDELKQPNLAPLDAL